MRKSEFGMHLLFFSVVGHYLTLTVFLSQLHGRR
jgi:hypothetical protein